MQLHVRLYRPPQNLLVQSCTIPSCVLDVACERTKNCCAEWVVDCIITNTSGEHCMHILINRKP